MLKLSHGSQRIFQGAGGREHIGKGITGATLGAGIMTDRTAGPTDVTAKSILFKNILNTSKGLPYVCTWIASRCVTEIISVSCHAGPDGGAVRTGDRVGHRRVTAVLFA
jgi:hypothetical protein